MKMGMALFIHGQAHDQSCMRWNVRVQDWYKPSSHVSLVQICGASTWLAGLDEVQAGVSASNIAIPLVSAFIVT